MTLKKFFSLLSQMNPESRPSFTELVAELEKRVSDREQSECMEPDVQGEEYFTYIMQIHVNKIM